MHPVIGITLDREETDSYSKLPWYAVRENYVDPIANLGGTPVLLPYHCDYIENYLDIISGIIITGGDFDIDPKLYGQLTSHSRIKLKPKRCEFEYKLASKAIERNMPVLGICGGHQLINVIFGGSLIPHIPEDDPNYLSHEQSPPFDQPAHIINITPKSQLHQIMKMDTALVNTAHHQAVARLGKGLVDSAVAPDGIIEGIESTQHKFCIGVQWHPEYLITEGDRRLFSGLIQACQS